MCRLRHVASIRPGQVGVLVRGDHPAHDVATEEIQPHTAVIQVGDRPFQLSDIPRPDLIRGRRHELRFRVRRMPRRRAAPGLPPRRRECDTSCAWRRDTSVLRAAWPALRRATDRRTARCARRAPPGVRRARARAFEAARGVVDRRPGGLSTPIEGRAREADTLTEGRGGARRGHRLDGDHQSGSSVSRGFRGIPRISATFFWSVMIVSARCSFRCSRRLGFELFHARVNRPRLGSSPASAHVLQGALLALPTPVGEQGRVQPLRRNRAPSSRGFLQASACVRMRSRYSAGKRRRWAFAGTSGSGSVGVT